MEIRSIKDSVTQINAAAVVVGAFADGSLTPSAAAVDEASGGLIRRLAERGEWKGKPFELATLYEPAGVKSPIVLLIGLGEPAKFDAAAAFRTAAAAARQLSGKARGKVAFYLGEGATTRWIASSVAGA